MSKYGLDTLPKGWGTSFKTRNYTGPGSCIKTKKREKEREREKKRERESGTLNIY